MMNSEERNKELDNAAVVGDVEPTPSAAPIDEENNIDGKVEEKKGLFSSLDLDELSKKDEEILEAMDALNELVQDEDTQDDLEIFARLLAVPDDTFKALEDVLLSNFEIQLSDTNTVLQLAQSLNISLTSPEELRSSTEAFCNKLEEELKDLVTPYKIQFLRKYFSLIINAVEKTMPVGSRIVEIPIEICRDGAKVPQYANIGDAGLDVYALDDYEIMPGETRLIPTGFKVAVPKGYELQVRPRSGLSLKTKLRIANAPGTIDAGYRDEIGIIVENTEQVIKNIDFKYNSDGTTTIKYFIPGQSYFISKGSKIAQLVLNEIPTVSFTVIDDINTIAGDRGGGFGSTDKPTNVEDTTK